MKGGKYAKTLVKIQVRAIGLNFYLKWGLNSPQAWTILPWVPDIFSRVRGASSAAGRHVFDRHGRLSAGHFLRLDRNRKPRMKSLWHPG